MKHSIRQILKEQVDYSNFCLPVKGWGGSTSAAQNYGARRRTSTHMGIDLSTDSGDPLYAPEDGTIKYAKFFTPWDPSLNRKENKDNGYNACGGYIQIKHANNIVTKYCHLKQIDVTPGETVVRGQLIGLTGGDSAANSPSGVDDKGRGNSSHSHLHYEVLVNGSHVNPDPDFVRNGECDGTVVVTTPLTGCTAGDCEDGYGTYIWPSGNKYVGEWVDGMMHGQGIYTTQDGDKYVGENYENMFQGQGTYYYIDGGVYVGEWKDDERHGEGKMTHADGTIEEGQWEEDEFVRQNIIQDYTPDTPFTNEDRENNINIQELLQLKKFLDKGYTIEGIMDEETIEAIKALQTAASLPVNGIFDKDTAIALTSNRYFGDK